MKNVIETLIDILNGYQRINEFTKGSKIKIDFVDEGIEGAGLYSDGDRRIKKYITGHQDRTHRFLLYSVNASTMDFDRLNNSNFLLELAYYLDSQKNIPIVAMIGEKQVNGEIKEISCSDGMKFSVDTKTKNFIYQIQISVNYKLVEEE